LAGEAEQAQQDYANLRIRYLHEPFRESDLAPTPLQQFERWYAQAQQAAIPEPNAMMVATVGEDSAPSARHVLMKGADGRGFVFYTNYESQKGRELLANPATALVFPWIALFRQVVIQGSAERLSREESVAYFNSRPYGSRIGAWASRQSQPVESIEDFERDYATFAARYPEGSEVPTPPNWGGFLVRVKRIEFWAGHESRLHDRLRYESISGAPAPLDDAKAWRVQRIFP
jgi:pyridoxamine 5'-phosphate oxidase